MPNSHPKTHHETVGGPDTVPSSVRHYTAFDRSSRIASGTVHEIALKVKAALEQRQVPDILVFDNLTSETLELDLRGSDADVLARLQPAPPTANTDAPAVAQPEEMPRGPGRPRLGVIAREVTLLPRHWDWLSSQRGGASVALRKLVEEARRAHEGKDRLRHAQESAYRFISTIAGSLSGFEEASRALFAGDSLRFDEHTQAWPADLRSHAQQLARLAFVNAEEDKDNA